MIRNFYNHSFLIILKQRCIDQEGLVTIKTNFLLHYMMSKIHQNTHRIVLKC